MSNFNHRQNNNTKIQTIDNKNYNHQSSIMHKETQSEQKIQKPTSTMHNDRHNSDLSKTKVINLHTNQSRVGKTEQNTQLTEDFKRTPISKPKNE